MDRFNALYCKVQQDARAAEREERRKEAEREAETRWMCNMVTRSSEKRYAQRVKAMQKRAAKSAALSRKLNLLLVFCVIALGASLVLLLFKRYLFALLFANVSNLFLLLCAAAIEAATNSTRKKGVKK